MAVRIYGGGGGGVYSDDTTATKAQVLQGYTTITSDSNDEVVAGAMINNGTITQTLNCGGSINLSGYYEAGSKVTANSLASQTSADATAAYLYKGKTAWVNGQKITGTMTVSGVTSFKVTVASHNSVTCEWTWGSDSRLYTGVAIRYNASSTAPTTATSGTKGYQGQGSKTTGTSTCTITGLKENTTYSFALFTYLVTSVGTLYSSSLTVLNVKTPLEFDTKVVYDGSSFYDYMKSGVLTGTLASRPHYPGYDDHTIVQLIGFGQSSTSANVAKTSGALSSGTLTLGASADEWTYHGGFISRDLINLSKFASITIEGTMTFTRVYLGTSERRGVMVDIGYSDETYGGAYVIEGAIRAASDFSEGSNWQSHTTSFSKTVDISSWNAITSGRLVVFAEAYNDYTEDMNYSFTITKIKFNI